MRDDSSSCCRRSCCRALPSLPRHAGFGPAVGGALPVTTSWPTWLLKLNDHFPIRYLVWLVCAIGLLLERLRLGGVPAPAAAMVLLFLLLTVAWASRDTRQTRHSVLRNYPVIGHLRFLLEFIRPEIRQYFIEGDHDGRAVLAPAALARLPARQGRARQAAVRHAARRRTRTATSGSTTRSRRRRSPSHDFRVLDRRRPCAQPYSAQRLQHLGDELRRAVGQRDPRAQRGREARRLRPRHRRGLDQRATTASTAAT